MASDKAMAPLITNPTQPEEPKENWIRRLPKLVRIILVVGVLFLASLWLVSAFVDLSIFAVYGHFIDNIKARLQINTYLANALSLLLLVPFAVGAKYYLFSFRNKKRQNAGLAILLCMGVLYNLVLYFGTRNENFCPNGEPCNFFALVPGGVVFSDRAGTEPKYGVPFRPVTREIIPWLERIKKGHIESVSDPAHRDWFDSVKRDYPLLWYYADSRGEFHFFDGPGYAPATGEELKPVTIETRRQWEKRTSEAADPQNRATPKNKIALSSQVPKATSQPYPKGNTEPMDTGTSDARSAKLDERQQLLEEFKSLLNTNLHLVPGKKNIAILVALSGTVNNFSAEQAFYGHLSSERVHFITDFFRESLVRRGYFDEIYNGDQEMWRIVTTSTGVDSLILGRMNYAFRRVSPTSNDLVTCDIGFSYKVVSQDGVVVKSDSFRVGGAGFSEPAALERAIEILGQQFPERILNIP